VQSAATEPSEPGQPRPINGSPWSAAPGPEPRRAGRRRLPVAGAIAVATAAAGAPLGVLWAVIAPDVPVSLTDSGPVLGDPAPEQFIAADGWFTLLGLAFGALAAVTAWALARRSRGPLGLLACVLGAVVAGIVAWQVGRHIGLSEYHRLLDRAAAGQTLGMPGDLHAARARWWPPDLRGDVLVPAFAAAAAYTLLAGWSRHPSLRDPRRTGADRVAGPVLSWGSPPPPAPTAAPAPPAPGEAAPPPA
jgi:hypothetical protein